MPTADDVDLGYAYTLAPEEAINYFESKGYAIGFNWFDVRDVAHARSFTVAGVMKLDVLQDIRGALQSALENGDTWQEFVKGLLPLLEAKGWMGKGLVADPETGELQGKQLTPRRLQTIFDTNIQSSYNVGRYQQQMANVADRPYFERVAVMDSHTRPRHAALNRFTAPADDPVWEYLYPPDGYGCRCRIRARSQADVEKYGLTVQSSEGRLVEVEQEYGQPGQTIKTMGLRMPDGSVYTADAGFGYNPGRVAWQPELDKYHYASARQYVTGSLTGPDFARALRNTAQLDARQRYPLAVLSPDQMGHTGADRQTVSLSAPVMQQLAQRDTPPLMSDYVLIQQTIENAQTMTQSGNAWRYSMQYGKRWSVATVQGGELTGWALQDTPGA
ncbi:phage head morphogenesis protein [Intestinirhabdus alba]|jgi:SPP1 gp7 family putative phage head morphogenesis protein|uniref:Phage head morphogenesis protein n=1 Tax=Intestinirhabdus alba TaxID=2899544 RepID=A0A6L6IRP5_9ENTR|nr:phage minor head protein [Intestinirhabdus alba]MTH47483.1 phage head morphogenesis protein [Intestinirhabdus alba]